MDSQPDVSTQDTDEQTTTQCTFTLDPTDSDVSDETSLTEPWDCPHATHSDFDLCPFHLSVSERETADISDDDIVELAVEKLTTGTPAERELIGTSLPELPLGYLDIENTTQHPLDLRHSTIRGDITAVQTRFEEQLDVRHSNVGGFIADDARFEDGVLATDASFDGDVSLFEATVSDGNAEFNNALFGGHVDFNEVTFTDDVTFADAVFAGESSFAGAEFHGRAAEIDDKTTFENATFNDVANFKHAKFESTVFHNVSFDDDAIFTHIAASESLRFTDAEFSADADFREATFNGDVSFDQVVFGGGAQFTGAEFYGGAAVVTDDVTFSHSVFDGGTMFEHCTFGYASFEHATFNDTVTFERSDFAEDLTFADAAFQDTADFDEITVNGDADFATTTFHANAVFRGSEFRGGTNHLEDDVIFDDAMFKGDADFHDVLISSASFMRTEFYGDAGFTDSEFTNRLNMEAVSLGTDTYVNFTDAVMLDGSITQPSDGWVRFDFTQATIGDVELAAATQSDRRELLDYFRICDTDFDGFDFSAHTEYLDRNGWILHEFDSGDYHDGYTVSMTPETIERTYLKAKRNASNQSNIKAAGEFRVKRQQNARSKFFAIARDGSETLRNRVRNGLRAAENYFLGVTCGYGLRLYRIAVVFILFPLLSAGLFAFGGPVFETDAGQLSIAEALGGEKLQTLALNVYFSYITFLTIGYGNIAPDGLGARAVSALLVYANVILAGLVLYALIKRSEV
ncbi:potassium channel family protein [Halovenus rubra]|uniref:Potassium channel family protein n=2 Tax=Halovenus rubra TaxID=869890 RepID=A0ABD5XCQ0_9EURY|nr:pentapeptide repeat-containing protein [Halovenus rubra]